MKTKKMTKWHSNVDMVAMWLGIRKLKYIKRDGVKTFWVIVSQIQPNMSITVCQNILIKNIKILDFSFHERYYMTLHNILGFITITPHGILNKKIIILQILNTTSYFTYHNGDHWVERSWKMLTYDGLPDPGLSHGKTFIKTVSITKTLSTTSSSQLTIKYQVNLNENQSNITRNLTWYSGKNVNTAELCHPDKTLIDTKDCLSNSTGVKLIRLNTSGWVSGIHKRIAIV